MKRTAFALLLAVSFLWATPAHASHGNLQRRIGGCESSGRPNGPLRYTVQNRRSSASGAYQFVNGTWRSFAKKYGNGTNATSYSRAMHAPPHVQDTVMARALADGQARHWNASKRCWR